MEGLHPLLRKTIVLVAGILILLTGIAMILLPGPALVVIPVGLAVLATEFWWAKWLLKRFANSAESAAGYVEKKTGGRIRLPAFVKRMLDKAKEERETKRRIKNESIALRPPRRP